MLNNGLLYYTCRGVQRLCIPRCDDIMNVLLYDCHDLLLGGYLGVDKTLPVAQRYYYWPKMEQDVRQYVETCHLCQEYKSQNMCATGLL